MKSIERRKLDLPFEIGPCAKMPMIGEGDEENVVGRIARMRERRKIKRLMWRRCGWNAVSMVKCVEGG